MKKIFDYLTKIFLYYFIFTFLAIYGLHHSSSLINTVFFNPVDLTYKFASSILHGELESFVHTLTSSKRNILDSYSKPVDKLSFPLYTIQVTAEKQPSLEIRDLHNQNVIWSERIPPHYLEKNAQFMLAYSDSIIVFAEWNCNYLGLVDISSNNFIRKEFDFTFHHNIDIVENKIVVNIRKANTDSLSRFSSYNDDGYAFISLNLNVEHEFYVSQIINEIQSQYGLNKIIDNPIGTTGDPFHLNDVFKVSSEGNNFKRNDILLSSRNTSSIIHLRNDTLVKLYTGDFRNQHDVDLVNDSTLSIFDNNSFDYRSGNGRPFKSRIAYHNVNTNHTSHAFETIDFASDHQGKFNEINDTLFVIENWTKNELIILSRDSVHTRGCFRIDEHHIELLNWNPYFTKL